VLELEPGRAFGTGLHETTALVAQVLASRKKDISGKSILDVGTGSGILALVALALGGRDAVGIDIDDDAIAVARENAARNSLAEHTRFSALGIDSIDRSFPVVLANIEADVLIGMASDLARHVAAGGILVLSGILATRKDDVRAAIARIPSLRLLETPSKGEWVALAYRSEAAA
jgi:ribosomal protein L11 methyltransferase